MVKLSIKESDSEFSKMIESFIVSFGIIKEQDPNNSEKYEKIVKDFLNKTIKEL